MVPCDLVRSEGADRDAIIVRVGEGVPVPEEKISCGEAKRVRNESVEERSANRRFGWGVYVDNLELVRRELDCREDGAAVVVDRGVHEGQVF